MGIVAILVGALFCFRGNVALRAVMSLWGAFAGFWVGAGAAAGLTDEPVLAGPIGWIAAVLLALLFGALAYAFYVLAVVIGMGSIGLGLGTVLASALGVGNDAVVLGVGLLSAAALAILAVTTRLPWVLLVVFSALGGAAAMVAGLILVLGVVTLDQGGIEEALAGQWWWTLVHLGLGLAGVIVQLRSSSRTDPRREWRQVEPSRA